jgi:PadR family transcriptional regulator, regulatory protein PadR
MIPRNEQAILSVLAENSTQELFGVQIMDAVNEMAQSFFSLNAGSLYPTLNKLKNKGYVSARWGDEQPEETGGARRRYYKITGVGQAALDETRALERRMSRWVNPEEGTV